MKIQMTCENLTDSDGNPAGGTVQSTGVLIHWQNGPLGRHDSTCVEGETCSPKCDRIPPNGAFVETVIEAAKQRLEYYNSSKFTCMENVLAIGYLNKALEELNARTARREERCVEGTHEK